MKKVIECILIIEKSSNEEHHVVNINDIFNEKWLPCDVRDTWGTKKMVIELYEPKINLKRK